VVSGDNADALVGINPATNKLDRQVKLPAACSDLAQGGPAVWVLCPNSNRVVKVDPVRRMVVGTATLSAPTAGFATPTDLWVGTDAGIVRLDAKTLKPRARIAGPDTSEGDVLVDGNRVWARSSNGFLFLIDSQTNRIVQHVTGEDGYGGGTLLLASGSLWTGAEDASLLLRLKRAGH
jgi:hypothetical protein